MFNTSKTIISNKMQGFCFLFFFSQEWRRVNEINIYEVCNHAPKCSRYEVYASIQTSDTTIVKEIGVY